MNHKIVLAVFLQLLLAACANHNARILEGGNQVELRNIQSRAFDTKDQNMVVSTVIATLQDLNFVIDKTDADLGTVLGTKLGGYQINDGNCKAKIRIPNLSESKRTIQFAGD